LRCGRVDREGVDARLQLAGERRIYHAVAFDPALPPECTRYDIDPEMSFTARPVAGMALVVMGLVDHREALWRESLRHLFFDDIASAHATSIRCVRAIRVNCRQSRAHLRGPEHVL